MKCQQKSSLNFFIFAPLNKVNVNFYQLVSRLSESISTSKKRRNSFFTKHRSFLYASKREKIQKSKFFIKLRFCWKIKTILFTDFPNFTKIIIKSLHTYCRVKFYFVRNPNLKKMLCVCLIMLTRRKVTFSSKMDAICVIILKR